MTTPTRIAGLGVTTLLRTWMARARQRRHLSELPDRLLADIGCSREQALRESRRPFWQSGTSDHRPLVIRVVQAEH